MVGGSVMELFLTKIITIYSGFPMVKIEFDMNMGLDWN
jgi:hypothetical protein